MTSVRNKTISLTQKEQEFYKNQLLYLDNKVTIDFITNQIILDDSLRALSFLPEDQFIDCVVADPPYNRNKKYGDKKFTQKTNEGYFNFIDTWCRLLLPRLKPTATLYVCSDWQSSSVIQNVLEQYFIVRNRITWEREKGRGSNTNWKNTSEDIWFCTVSNDYYFNADAVKLKRKVKAPYKDSNGRPKDWDEEENTRLTNPSNLWTDLTVPFWSMSENTEHPTQKPEKLVAKLILASTQENDFVFDPFLGSGTTAVVAKKLNRKFCGIELDHYYASVALKRLELAENNNQIQGYENKIFLDRNFYN